MARIVVVDYHDDWLHRMMELLVNVGHRAIPTSNRQEAMQELTGSPHADLVVCDIGSDGVGLRICRDAKELEITALAVAGNISDKQILNLYNEFDVAECLLKSQWNSEDFLLAVAKALNTAAIEAESTGSRSGTANELGHASKVDQSVTIIDSEVVGFSNAPVTRLNFIRTADLDPQVLARVLNAAKEIANMKPQSSESPETAAEFSTAAKQLESELKKKYVDPRRVRQLLLTVGGLATFVSAYDVIAPHAETIAKSLPGLFS